ncbi:MAG TPA: CDP-diacylglycerol--serine O-phosphatidyltransferase [Candidatus Tectomicrobia bacterium]|nr:CDP-diacylglycerol--serine O-phosphatidyltransferase [Candidatus Tectomicrobia bacterium]
MRKGSFWKVVPSVLTTGNLFCGFYGIIAALREDFYQAAMAILVAVVFDGLDGKVARLTKTTSNFGVEYDSLADLLSFGVAPSLILYLWALEPVGRFGWIAAFIFLICGALRLARFNVQVGQSPSFHFTGLPIPAAAGMVASLILLGKDFIAFAEPKPVVILGVACGLAFLMVSNIKYRSLKNMRLKGRHPNWWLLLIVPIFALIMKPELLIFVVFVVYIVSGPVERVVAHHRLMRESRAH